MAEMSLDEAMEILGVSKDVTERELKNTFRRLSRKAHPDRPGGSEARQKELNLARGIVRKELFDKRALVPIQIREPLQRMERAIAAERAMRQADQATRKAKARSLKKVTDLKWATLGMGGLSGAVGWLADSADTPLAGLFPEGSPYSGLLKLAAFVFGAIAAVLQFVTNARSQAIDTYTAELDDKQFCAAELAEALGYQSRAKITAADLDAYRQIETNLPLPPSLMGHFRRSGILILKSVGHGLLEEIESQEIRPDREIEYRVKFEPIRFRSTAPDSELEPGATQPGATTPSAPMSISDAGWAAASPTAVTVGLAWLAQYLLSRGHSFWGWFTIFWAVMFGLAALAFTFEFVGAVKRRRLAASSYEDADGPSKVSDQA